ncbi:MAG: 3-methyl-2-oxobutanoate dehydrogenase subunit VorB [Pseudomonadota bacterium]
MKIEFIKGNEAVIKAAIIAGCDCYFGYPITPASEIAQAASYYMPLFNRTFIQAESEVAAINMVYGAASAGSRVMTASSGPGISLKQEGVSYIAGAELPCVIVDVTRAGPGLGNIWPEQGDYNQLVKGGGHGNYKCIVLAANSAQEMADFTFLSFELADKYRIPVYLLSDAYIGQMMEPVKFPEEVKNYDKNEKKDWATLANEETRKNLVTSIHMNTKSMEEHNIKLQNKYSTIQENEERVEFYNTDDAEYIFISYGITSRVVMSAVDELRQLGIKAGLLRPLTLWPHPIKALEKILPQTKKFIVVECSNGQLRDDISLFTKSQKPILLYNRMGGAVPSVKEVVNFTKEIIS